MAAEGKQGSGLKKKIGPLPLFAWVVVAVLLVGYFLFFRKGSASAQTAPSTAADIPVQSTADQSAGLVPSAGSSADSGSSTSDLLAAYGAENSNLTGALLQTQQNVVALATSQQNALASTSAVNSSDTSNGVIASTQPGGSNAPSFSFSFPNITSTDTVAKPAAKTAATVKSAGSTAKTAATPVKYQTYKRDVVLKQGQTVHFRTGSGYYAA